jgi:hypothetical protein
LVRASREVYHECIGKEVMAAQASMTLMAMAAETPPMVVEDPPMTVEARVIDEPDVMEVPTPFTSFI